jgi:hypothetical protein
MGMLTELFLKNRRKRKNEPGQFFSDISSEEYASHPGGNAELVGRGKVCIVMLPDNPLNIDELFKVRIAVQLSNSDTRKIRLLAHRLTSC